MRGAIDADVTRESVTLRAADVDAVLWEIDAAESECVRLREETDAAHARSARWQGERDAARAECALAGG